jgi:uncharacterized protein (TIGR02284 family)
MDNKNWQEAVDVLNDLIETCKDGEYGFRASSEHTASAQVRKLFEDRASECRDAATQLQAHVARLGGSADTSGSVGGALHRGWVAVRSVLSTHDDLAMLEECERGEDAALASYRKALASGLPADLQQVVQQQCNGVQRNHNMIRDLRDAMKAGR